ncbi:MAG: metallophosphoesterase [Deltaproteobacteria bacterium]|nr:MAG: metallophosphoesterase [Deltaproteobacteria bacterium]
MRIAHMTDIHWQVRPSFGDLSPKRVLGSLNLYVRGRHSHFTEAVQGSLVQHVLELAPDAVFITGDLTAQALDTEFAKAKLALQPLLERIPTLIIPGNHDVYTFGSQRSRRMEAHFGEWMGLDAHRPVARLDVGDVTLLGLDPNRPHPVFASGIVPRDQLDGLAAILADPEMAERRIILGMHHPPVDRRGDLYDGLNHGLVNAREFVAVLEQAPVLPMAILCGHVHHGFHSQLSVGDRRVDVFDAGSSGYAFMPDSHRAACMNLYDVDDALAVERFQFDGTGFSPEPGGAYATGR